MQTNPTPSSAFKSTGNRNLLVAISVLLLPGCADYSPQPKTLSVAEVEANRAYTEQIARSDADQEDLRRLRQAHVTEVSTRHAPTSVSTTQVYAPRY